MKELVKIQEIELNNELVQAVSARELYVELGLDLKNWSRWSETNIIENEFFTQPIDFIDVVITSRVGFEKTKDYFVTLDMAKHLAMQCRNEKGHTVRNYFLECEKQIKQPRVVDSKLAVMIEALIRIDQTEQRQLRLEQEVKQNTQRLDQLDVSTEYFTVIGYFKHHRLGSIPEQQAAAIGKKLSKYCRNNNIRLGSVPHARYGDVYSYPEWVFQELGYI